MCAVLGRTSSAVPAFLVPYFIPRGSKWHSERIIEINWGPHGVPSSDSPLLDAVAATTELKTALALTHTRHHKLLTDPKPPPSPPPSHYFCCRGAPDDDKIYRRRRRQWLWMLQGRTANLICQAGQVRSDAILAGWNRPPTSCFLLWLGGKLNFSTSIVFTLSNAVFLSHFFTKLIPLVPPIYFVNEFKWGANLELK